jgi:hypothetical protein
MKKKLLLIAFTLLVLIVAYIVATTGGESKQDALNEAKDYQTPSSDTCTSVMTKAVHAETGLHYTFPTSCLPPGWETVQPDN